MHTSLIPLECNAKAMVTGNNNVSKLVLASLNPNMNYGVLHCNKIAEMMNNATGNKAHLWNLPLPALDNNQMHLIDYQLVSSIFENDQLSLHE